VNSLQTRDAVLLGERRADDGAVLPICAAARAYQEHGTPVVVMAGKDYGARLLP
jgi:hypothetical protein